MIPFAAIDGLGIYGSFFHYGMVIAFVGGAFIIFFQLWRKGKLDMDEEPAEQMLREETETKERDHARK